MCECDRDEMLPCEAHMVLIAQREGASLRTADELQSVFIHDAVGAGAELSPWGQGALEDYDAALESNRSMGVAWLPEDADELAFDMSTLQSQVEASLDSMDDPVYTSWDDGYVMYRLAEDCPLR